VMVSQKVPRMVIATGCTVGKEEDGNGRTNS
jgi:hypothetical protein